MNNQIHILAQNAVNISAENAVVVEFDRVSIASPTTRAWNSLKEFYGIHKNRLH